MSVLEQNGLYEVDCLTLLERIANDCIGLVYIDSPWHSFGNHEPDIEYVRFMRRVIRQSKRILSPTGNLFIHIYPESGVFIRPILDMVFDAQNYCPEIAIPKRRPIRVKKSQPSNEIILHYVKSTNYTYNRLVIPATEDEELLKRYRPDDLGRLYMLMSLTLPHGHFSFEFRGHFPGSGKSWRFSREQLEQLDQEGRIYQLSPEHPPKLKRYIEDHPGVDITDKWDDSFSFLRGESRRYPEQKPLILMDKLIQIGSNPGDIVLDPLCGTGTTLVAAHRFNRKWIGCDNSGEAIAIAQQRLQEECGLASGLDYVNQSEEYLINSVALVRSSFFPRFFISYKRLDFEEFVSPFLKRLDEEGIDYWRDNRDIPSGEEWEKALDNALSQTDAMILFVTPEALASEYVQREYNTFLGEGKKIFPLLCKDVDMDYPLGHLHHTPYDDDSFRRFIDQLLKFKPN